MRGRSGGGYNAANICFDFNNTLFAYENWSIETKCQFTLHTIDILVQCNKCTNKVSFIQFAQM